MTYPLRRCSWLAISWFPVALMVMHQPLLGQTPVQPDQRHTPVEGLQLTVPTDAGAYLKYWSTGNTGGSGAHTIFLQNTSADRTIVVTSWEVYDCYNIRGAVCRVHDKKMPLKPRDTIRLVELFPAVTGQEFSYRYRFVTTWQDTTSATP